MSNALLYTLEVAIETAKALWVIAVTLAAAAVVMLGLVLGVGGFVWLTTQALPW